MRPIIYILKYVYYFCIGATCLYLGKAVQTKYLDTSKSLEKKKKIRNSEPHTLNLVFFSKQLTAHYT